jgi:hypothetical protein
VARLTQSQLAGDYTSLARVQLQRLTLIVILASLVYDNNESFQPAYSRAKKDQVMKTVIVLAIYMLV